MEQSAAEVTRCAGQLAAAHGWAAAELLWQPPAPVWLLPALLLQLSRHGVFSRRGGGGGGTDRGASGTIQLAAPEEAVAARPLLLLPPRPVSPGRLARLAARLHGAELLQPDSGQLLRVARHADSGPLVTAIGHCRAGGLTPLTLPAPAPAGWRDLRVVNKTYRTARFDWFYPNPKPQFSFSSLANGTALMLEDCMGIHLKETRVIRTDHMKHFYDVFQNNLVDLATELFAWIPDRDPFLHILIGITRYDTMLFVRTPEPTSSPSYSGSLESVRLQVLAVCLLLLVTAGGYLTFRLSGAADTRFSTFCLQTLGTFCAQGLALQPGSVSQHIAAVVMFGVSMMTFQFFAAGLLAQVTTEQAHLPFSQPDDVTRMPDWRWALYQMSVSDNALRCHPRPGMNFTGAIDQAHHDGNAFEWASMARTQKFAFFLSPLDLVSTCSWAGCPGVCPHPQYLARYLISLPIRRGLPEWRAFDAVLLRLMETGMLSRLRRRHLPDRLLSSLEHCDLEARPRTQWSAISLPECWPVFGVLLGGAGAALVLLLLELLAGRFSNMSKQK